MLYDKKWDKKVKSVTRARVASPKHKLPGLEQWRQDLLAAASYIREHGWIQDWMEMDATGEVCIMGSLIAVTGEWGERVDMAGEKLILHHRGIRARCSVEDWNDDPRRTKDQVIRALEQVAHKKEV